MMYVLAVICYEFVRAEIIKLWYYIINKINK